MKTFKDTQKAFVEHLRNPDKLGAFQDIEDRRLKIYRELFFNNILGFLSSGFPVLESIYGEEKWQTLARQFFRDHHCRSPYFVDISKEFVEYLSNEYEMTEDDPIFLQALAHYEWLELDVSVKKSHQGGQPWDGSQPISDVCLSDTAVLAGYEFPVHQISKDYQPREKTDPVYVIVYRNTEFDVGFTVVNDVTAHLVNILSNYANLSLEKIIDLMSKALPQIPSEQVDAGTRDIVNLLLEQQVLLIPLD